MDKFEVFLSFKNNRWYFRRRAANGEIVSQSQGYRSKQSAVDEATRQADGLEVEIEERKIGYGD